MAEDLLQIETETKRPINVKKNKVVTNAYILVLFNHRSNAVNDRLPCATEKDTFTQALATRKHALTKNVSETTERTSGNWKPTNKNIISLWKAPP